MVAGDVGYCCLVVNVVVAVGTSMKGTAIVVLRHLGSSSLDEAEVMAVTSVVKREAVALFLLYKVMLMR